VKRYREASAHRIEAAALTDGERAEIAAVASERHLAIETARMAAGRAPGVDEIIEAHARTDAEAVRAWIAELGQPIRLDADRLVRLADAGVSPEVIDVAVAVSYPERFALARQPDAAMERDRQVDGRRYDWDRYRFGSWYYDPFYYDPYSFDRYGYAARYGYAPGYGRGGWYGAGGWYGGGWYNGPGVIIVQPVQEARKGRLVKGRGYTGAGSSGGTAAVPRNGSGASSSGGSNAAVGASRAPAPSASPSPRVKAKPRPSGGGGGGDDGS
jgi:hypothetical protein